MNEFTVVGLVVASHLYW